MSDRPPMIESVHFTNFKALRNTTLKLGKFNLLIGPNGCGKSTVLQALQAVSQQTIPFAATAVSVASAKVGANDIHVMVEWGAPAKGGKTSLHWNEQHGTRIQYTGTSELRDSVLQSRVAALPARWQFYSLDSDAISQDVTLSPVMQLGSNGSQLAGVLDRLRDQSPERFEDLNRDLGRWLPEYDRVLFDTVGQNVRRLYVRTRHGQYRIEARQLSQGTLLALAMLTIAYLPDPPPLVGFEEPDRGLHPRLLRDVRDALYRLAYPDSYGDVRKPVQVIATTHSPYLLDLFRDHTEEIVITNKKGDNVEFARLSDSPDLHAILQDSHLGDAWYTGILGGVPANT